MRIQNLASLLFLGAVAAMAQYKAKTVLVLSLESYPARTEVGGITLAADPYPTDAKSFTAFDIRDLNSRGYYPVHIIVKNGTKSFITVKTRNAVLVTASGQELYTIPASTLVEDLFKGKEATSMKAGSPLLDFSEKQLTNRQLSPGASTDGFVFFYWQDTKKNQNLFAGSTLRIPEISDDDARKKIGPFLVPIDPALPRDKAAPKP
jgi:hypothetical protein